MSTLRCSEKSISVFFLVVPQSKHQNNRSLNGLNTKLTLQILHYTLQSTENSPVFNPTLISLRSTKVDKAASQSALWLLNTHEFWHKVGLSEICQGGSWREHGRITQAHGGWQVHVTGMGAKQNGCKVDFCVFSLSIVHHTSTKLQMEENVGIQTYTILGRAKLN